MSKVFGKDNGRSNNVGRNSVDLSFQNNLSCQFGYNIPVLCQEVINGDSIQLDLTAAFRMMPMVFPVQTRMRADFHAFYVRNRNLWKDWPDFQFNTKEGLIPPYVDGRMLNEFTTGSLADYLGLPTTVVGDTGVHNSLSLSQTLSYFSFSGSTSGVGQGRFPYPPVLGSTLSGAPVLPAYPGGERGGMYNCVFSVSYFDVTVPAGSLGNFTFNNPSDFPYDAPANEIILKVPSSVFSLNLQCFSQFGSGNFSSSLSPVSRYGSDYIGLPVVMPSGDSLSYSRVISFLVASNPTDSAVSMPSLPLTLVSDGVYYGVYPDTTSPVDYVGTDFGNPFESEGYRVSALPFRAYEAIYNAFYRDERNNPFILDGQPEYNKYIPTDEGGADSTVYTLRRRNWEQDQFTTSLPTPQFGQAPLVGITSTGTMSFQDPDTGRVYNVEAVTADDNDTIVSVKYTENVPNSVSRSLMNYITAGISINDFRNVNAYQRWLETNLRRGMKYRDQIKAHYDVDVSYQTLDMPEFVGGTSIDVNVTSINQTSESTSSSDGWSSPLGSYAGQGFIYGNNKHKITKYFDEAGYFIVIMSVTPVPNYSQIVPKHFYKRHFLDYFTPEFGHIGLQSVPIRELAPVQSYVAGVNPLTTFGYQRPWYDYLIHNDEVHGLLRTQLRNFVMNRTFNGVPVLSEDFLLVDPKQLNDVFAVTDVTDKIVGQIYFDMQMKRPIPLFGVPRLEPSV